MVFISAHCRQDFLKAPRYQTTFNLQNSNTKWPTTLSITEFRISGFVWCILNKQNKNKKLSDVKVDWLHALVERYSASDSSYGGPVIRVWVQILVMTLVSLSKKLTYNWFSSPRKKWVPTTCEDSEGCQVCMQLILFTSLTDWISIKFEHKVITLGKNKVWDRPYS